MVTTSEQSMETRIGNVETRMGALEGRMGTLETDLRDLGKEMRASFADTNRRIDRLLYTMIGIGSGLGVALIVAFFIQG